MTARRPRDPDAVIRRLRASLDERSHDPTVTPAFVRRVQRLRRRLFAWRVTQAVTATAVLVAGAVVAVDALQPPARLEFSAPPSASPSAGPPVPSASPPALPSEAPASEAAEVPAPRSEPPADPGDQRDEVPPAEAAEPSEAPGGRPTEAPARTRLFLDGTARPAEVCRNADGTLLATIDLPEAETGYTIDPADPATMTITGEGFTDVSDRVTVAPSGATTTWTATFATDNDDFGVSEVRVVGPTDPAACG